MTKDIGGLFLSFNEPSHYDYDTTEGNTTDGLQGGRKIDLQLRCTYLGVKTYMTLTTEKSNIHRTRL